jgi:hypothetical protein
MTADTAAPSPPVPANVTLMTVRADAKTGGSGFDDLLSQLNPLQYIPVIGTIYRAVTGDVIPESSRSVGSLVVSFLTGGPIGVATNVAAQAAEKITGIDPEAIGQNLLAEVGIGHHARSEAVPVAAPPLHAATSTRVTATQPGAPPAPATGAWSAAQLSAYGVTTPHGTLRRGSLQGCDVLNDLELARHVG